MAVPVRAPLYLAAAEVARVRASGARVQVNEIAESPERQAYTVDRDADFLVARYPLDLRACARSTSRSTSATSCRR